MDAGNGLSDRVGPKARLLLLAENVGEGAALGQRFPPAGYEVIACPLSVPIDGWVAELRPDLLLLQPADEARLLEVCRAARAQTDRLIVALSFSRSDLLVAQVLGSGIDEYLALPIGDRELLARVDAMLRRAHQRQSDTAPERIGGLLLSAVDQTVERAGRKIVLSPIEFRLLACLASAPGKVLTHQTLMARVWGAEYVDSRHYLRVYIRYLREKLEDDPADPQLILSEWGVGYRFQLPEADRLPPSLSNDFVNTF